MAVNQSDVILYQFVVAILVGAATFVGCKFGGHYYRESRAHTIEIGDRPHDPDSERAAAKSIAQGFKDTQAYINMEKFLTAEDISAAYVTLSKPEQYCFHAAGALAVIAFFASVGGGRAFARKREAQGKVSAAAQRFGGR